MSIMPSERQSANPGHAAQLANTLKNNDFGLDKIDFSKPERYLREIYEFLNSVTILNLADLMKKKNTLNQKDAQMVLFNLIRIAAPNY